MQKHMFWVCRSDSWDNYDKWSSLASFSTYEEAEKYIEELLPDEFYYYKIDKVWG